MRRTRLEAVVDRFVNAAGVSTSALHGAPWIADVEKRLPARFPPSFSSLVTRYRFKGFDVGPIEFFANQGDGGYEELSERIFADPVLWRVCAGNGFVQFGRPSDGSYDPLCFDIRKRSKRGELAVVRLDHEEILQHECVRVVDEVVPSLLEFMREISAHGR